MNTDSKKTQWAPVVIQGIQSSKYEFNDKGQVRNRETGQIMKSIGKFYPSYVLRHPVEKTSCTVSIKGQMERVFGVTFPKLPVPNVGAKRPGRARLNREVYGKPVICTDHADMVETRYDCTHDAEKALGLYQGSVSKYCTGNFKGLVRKRYSFRYTEKEL